MSSNAGPLRAVLLAAATCLAGCTLQILGDDDDHIVPPDCGDGVLDPGELCDDGNTVSGDGCSARCDSTELCGNGILDVARGEVCDDGNTVDADGCRSDCRSDETCGNGIVDVQLPRNPATDPAACLSATTQGTGCAEVCDDGNHVSGDGCSANCLSEESCRNGILDPAGNGSNNPPEHCDDGNQIDTDLCRNDCQGAGVACGNGVVDPGEQCDAFAQSTPGCDRDCTLPLCGDALVNPAAGEQCDPGIIGGFTAACDNDCTAALCGDGRVNPAAGEQCDDGNNIDGDGCRNDCRLP